MNNKVNNWIITEIIIIITESKPKYELFYFLILSHLINNFLFKMFYNNYLSVYTNLSIIMYLLIKLY